LGVIETTGQDALRLRDMAEEAQGAEYPPLRGQVEVVPTEVRLDYHQMALNLSGIPQDDGRYTLRLSVWAYHAGDLLGAIELEDVPAERLRGGIALVSDPGGQVAARHSFHTFTVGGEKLDHHPGRTFGPVAGTLHTLSGGILKLSAQFAPLGDALLPRTEDAPRPRMAATLQYRPSGTETWTQAGPPLAIAPPEYLTVWRIEGWDDTQDHEARILFTDEDGAEYTYDLSIPKDPADEEIISAAGITGQSLIGMAPSQGAPETGEGEAVVGRWRPANVWFPFRESVEALLRQEVDIIFFTGDQIYESRPTWRGGDRFPATDYLNKWLLWHWAFQDITRQIPAVCQPDDHDVYQGNIWGWGGRLNLTGANWHGGYLKSPHFVNMVQRSQTAHLPDAYDPEPALTGITHYYTDLEYGGVDFAILEDRKFKTPSQVTDPDEQVLLGERQLQFLEEWARGPSDFKVAVSQTGYATMHVTFEGELPQDPDSGGFPKVGRDRAVRAFSEAGAFVLCGDQHLGTFVRLGVDEPSDGPYQLCVPALANFFWRWWYPDVEGQDRAPGQPEHLGEFVDAYGNYLRMIAVANPEREDLLDQRLRARNVIPIEEAELGYGDTVRTCQGDGYGILRMNKAEGLLTVECWPHNADPADPSAQFPGWPVVLESW
jgi:alkaline phosphatase D